jgi:hypothetical protein
MKRLTLGFGLVMTSCLFAAPNGAGIRHGENVRMATDDEVPLAVKQKTDEFYEALGGVCTSVDVEKVTLAPAFQHDKLIGYALSTGTHAKLEGTPFQNRDVLVEIDGQPAADRLDSVCRILSGKDRPMVTIVRGSKRLKIDLRS